jgi:hypothetical protein
MKKILFSLNALTMALGVQAQGSAEAVINQGTPVATKRVIPVVANGHVSGKKVRAFGNNGVTIGTTFYDLQSNGSMSHRIINRGTGQISAVWTSSQENVAATGAFSDRGTAYNYKNGAAWGAFPTTRREPFRSGFTNILDIGGFDYITSHNVAGGGSYIYKNAGLGSSVFGSSLVTFKTALTTDTIAWPKTAVSGDNIYVLGTQSGPYDSLTTQLYFSYSPDGGVTWPKKCITMPGLTKNELWASSADGYNIDAYGSKVAVVVGSMANNLICLISNDYGNTWTGTEILSNGLLPGNPYIQRTFDPTDSSDTKASTDGSASVHISQDSSVNVMFSIGFYRIDSTTQATNILNKAAGYSYFPTLFAGARGVNTMFNWNSKAPTAISVVDSLQDCNGDAKFTFGSGYFKSGTNTKDAIYGAFSPTNMSQMASEATTESANVYCVYSAVIDGDTTEPGGVSPLAGQNFRDIFVMFSSNGGTSWSKRVNISNTPGEEDAFPSIAKLIDGKLHILWQADSEPGTVLQSGDNQDGGCQMRYIALPTSWVQTHAADADRVCQDETFIPEAIFDVDALGRAKYAVIPNPASTNLTVEGNMTGNTVTVVNAMGQVMNVKAAIIDATHAQLNVQNLASGVYFVKVTGKNVASSTRFVKQ